MAKCFDNKSGTHDDASDCIIEKLILDPLLIGTSCREKHADLIDEFEDGYGEFTNRQGGFAKDNIWLVAAKPDTEGYHWHAKYSIETAVVLGKLVRIGAVNDSCILSWQRGLEAHEESKEGRPRKNRVDKINK